MLGHHAILLSMNNYNTISFCSKQQWEGKATQDTASPNASPPTFLLLASFFSLPSSSLPHSLLCSPLAGMMSNAAMALREDLFSFSCYSCSCLTALAFTLAWMVLHRGSIWRSMPAHRERRGRDRIRLRCWVGTPTPTGTLSTHRTAPQW